MFRFFVVNTKKEFIYLKRYLINNILELLIFFILMITLLGGIDFFSSAKDVESNKQYLILSYLLWYLSLTMTQGIANDLLTEANQGTLEQLSLSKYSLEKIYFIKMNTNLLVELLFIITMLCAALLFTGVTFKFNFVSFIIVFPIIVIYLFGMAYIICALSVVFKNISSFLQIYQFLMMLIIFTPYTKFVILKYLPLNYIVTIYRETIINKQFLLDVTDVNNIFVSYIHSIIYFIIGIIAFHKAIIYSKRNGLLGHY